MKDTLRLIEVVFPVNTITCLQLLAKSTHPCSSWRLSWWAGMAEDERPDLRCLCDSDHRSLRKESGMLHFLG